MGSYARIADSDRTSVVSLYRCPQKSPFPLVMGALGTHSRPASFNCVLFYRPPKGAARIEVERSMV